MERRNVVIFCGGRGSANLIRAFHQDPEVNLSLLVNAYDDGLSTGRLRAFIPGLLGPSDLRKNMSYLLDLSTDAQFASLELLEYRFSLDAKAALELWKLLLEEKESSLTGAWRRCDRKQRQSFLTWLRAFEEYRLASSQTFDFADCALGNLFLAGAYLSENRNFNQAVSSLSKALRLRGEVLNVSQGENLFLAGRRRSGVWCWDEAEMVNASLKDPIEEIILVDQKPIAIQKASGSIESFSIPKSAAPQINPSALKALQAAECIIFGAGSQSSSLWPSYITESVADTIVKNKKARKVFLLNIISDHDIAGMKGLQVVEASFAHLRRLCPEGKLEDFFREILVHENSELSFSSLEIEELKPVKVVIDRLEHAENPGTHSGAKVMDFISRRPASENVSVSLVLHGATQEKLRGHYDRQISDLKVQLASHSLSIKIVDSESPASELNFHLGGDGIYSMLDLPFAIQLLQVQKADMIVGSRVLKRAQFQASLDSAYRLHPILQRLAKLGAFTASLIFSLRFGQFMSDPLSDWILTKKAQEFSGFALKQLMQTAREGGTILEMPIHYQRAGLSGSSQDRFLTGLKKLWTIVSG